jgi:hypothetical protein
MKRTQWSLLARILLVAVLASATRFAAAADAAGPPQGKGTHADLVALLDEFLQWQDPARAKGNNDEWLLETAGKDASDFSAAAVDKRRAKMQELQAKLADMNVASWNRKQQVDYLAVRARFDQENFTLNVSKPWSRDPGFYVEQMLRGTFTELPVKGDKLKAVRAELRSMPKVVGAAKQNLTEVAADYADLAMFNLANADGVGHGFPYRAVPPPGIIGWYADLLGRAEKQQRELVPDIKAAKKSAEDFLAWIKANRGSMNGQAGVGRENFDWYVKNVKLMPYTADEILTLGHRELERLWALYALEQHHNRNLPPLELSKSKEEYEAKIAATDKQVRKFLVEQDIITIPDYIKELDTNVPWIVRPTGPNFWEQIQFRDPHPDHLHAVIPGHRFDAVVERHSTDPIRSKLTDGVRVEGWGVYLEEGMMHAGVLDDQPRVKELIYLFGIFRAARVSADVWLQLNQMKVADVVKYWMERTPYLEPDVARVDAEIYLRRPPGYGLGYMMGMLQMQELLADSKRQLGDKFVLKDFHDTFMAAGRVPLSLIRWEMTGLDDEVKNFWAHEPLPAASR